MVDPSYTWRLGLHAFDLDADGHDTLGGSGSAPFYNVGDYGAVGDGSTDDTSAIEDTFDAADATGGGIIYLPATADYYKITSLITRTTTSKYHVLGESTRYGPARIHQATANTGVFKFNPSSGTTNRETAPLIESLVITGAGGASSGRGLEFNNDCHVRDCFIAGFYDGLYITGASYYSFVETSTFTDCDHAGLTMVGTNNTTIDTCRFTGNWGSASGLFGTMQFGIVLGGSSSTGQTTRITNTSVEYFTADGMWLDGGGPIMVDGCYFETQQSTSGYSHIKVGDGETVRPILIVGSHFDGNGISGFDAIRLKRCTAVTLESNRFGIGGSIGISTTSDTGPVLLINNYGLSGISGPASTYTLDPSSPPMSNPMTTAGDVIKGGTSGAPDRLAVGTDGDVLTVVSGAPAWATPSVPVSDLDDLGDVTLTSPAGNDTLRFDGSVWVNDDRRWEPVTFDPGTGPEIVFTATDIVMTWESY